MLNQGIDAGTEQGALEPTQFCEYGTPVVPVRKTLLPRQQKAKLRVCVCVEIIHFQSPHNYKTL